MHTDSKPATNGPGYATGPVTKRVQDAFFSAVGGTNEQYKHWLTVV